eukprot:252193_1
MSTAEYLFDIIVSVLIAIPLIISIYHWLREGISNDKTLNALMRLCAIAGFSICQIIFTITLIVSDIPMNIQIILICIANTCWLSSEFMLLLYFINRFYYAFFGTRYQFSNITYHIFYCGTLVYLITQFSTTINVILLYYNYYDYATANWFDLFCSSMSAISDTSLNCYILYSFTQKILLLICDMSPDQSIHAINVDQQQTKLLNKVTKYFILITCSIMSSLIALIIVSISDVHNERLHIQQYYLYPSSHYDWISQMGVYFWQIDCLCNTYCLFFEREYTNKYYNYLCGKTLRIHSCCKSFFISRAHKKQKAQTQLKLYILMEK